MLLGERRAETFARMLAARLPAVMIELQDCDHLRGMSQEELAAHCLIELVVEELNITRHEHEYTRKELSTDGLRYLKASFRQLDRISAEFYARDPDSAMVYAGRILKDIQDVFRQERESE